MDPACEHESLYTCREKGGDYKKKPRYIKDDMIRAHKIFFFRKNKRDPPRENSKFGICPFAMKHTITVLFSLSRSLVSQTPQLLEEIYWGILSFYVRSLLLC